MGMIMKDGIPYGGIYPIDDAPTQGSNNAVKSGGVFSSLSNKVDKIAGKGLSTNDYDNTEKEQNEANAEAIEVIVNHEKQNNLNLEVPKRVNLINSETFTNGYFDNTGAFVSNQYWYATDYIKVLPNTKYVVSGFSSGGGYHVLYNDNKEVIGVLSDSNTVIEATSNTVYVRLSIQRSSMTNPQMEIGTTATAYTPYIHSVESRIEAVEDAVNRTKVDITVEEGFSKTFDELYIINGVLVGTLAISNIAESDFPQGVWTKVATTSFIPRYTMQTVLGDITTGQTGGLMAITRLGEIVVYPVFPNPLSTSRFGVMGVFSHPL